MVIVPCAQVTSGLLRSIAKGQQYDPRGKVLGEILHLRKLVLVIRVWIDVILHDLKRSGRMESSSGSVFSDPPHDK